MSSQTRILFKRSRSSVSPARTLFAISYSHSRLLFAFDQLRLAVYRAVRRGEKPAIIQAILLILALGPASIALALRTRTPPQLIPDLLGCFAALLLLTPAVEAVRKMLAAKSKEDAAKSQ